MNGIVQRLFRGKVWQGSASFCHLDNLGWVSERAHRVYPQTVGW
jgi:hypothetical protein